MIMEENKKLFLLDAYALIYRAYYALIRSPRVTSRGLNVSAVFGFCNTLDEVLNKQRPDYIAVCFDPPGGKTFRHEAYPEYKAQRDKQPEDITLAIPYIKRVLEAHNIAVIEMERYEADDIIGTLTRQAEAEGLVTYMMTPDKDYGQLVTDKVLMYRPSLKGQGFEIRGPKEVCERYGIESPSQITDLLALEGDDSDNIPGCPGVGEKTASKLIGEWGSVENMLDHVSEIKGLLQRRIADNAEKIRFSKFLVTIKTDVPLDVTIEQLRRRDSDEARLAEVYRELEFKTLLSRLSPGVSAANTAVNASAVTSQMASLFDGITTGDAVPPGGDAASTLDLADVDFRIIETPAEITGFVDEAVKTDRIGIAMHAFGEEAMTAHWHGVAIALPDGRAAYLPAPETDFEFPGWTALLAPLFSSADITVAGHDIKRCMVILRRYGLDFDAGYFDTSVAHYLLSPEVKHDLPTVAYTYLRYMTADYAMTATERRKARVLGREEAMSLFCEAASVALRLQPVLVDELRRAELLDLYQTMERPLVAVLASMEFEGVRIDVTPLQALSRRLARRVDELERQAYDLAGMPFNNSSPAQVGELLFGVLKIDPKAKKTKRGAWSTAEADLEKYAHDVPLVRLILDIRGLRKLLATYVEALPKSVNPVTGKIHTTFNQTETATGRLSSLNPNLQNIPVRTDDGREIRKAFVPDSGNLILSCDYSQIELRLIADISGDPEMIDAFIAGEDIHRATAAKIFHKPLSEVTDDERRRAKTANFGIIYGISTFGLSERLGISRAEAKSLMQGYFGTYKRVHEYMDEAIACARQDGFVKTIHGRKRYLPDINSRNAVVRGYAERNAINAPLQGSAADIIKIAMVNVDREIRRRGLRSRMIMQVHDELIFNVFPDELDELRAMVVGVMKDAYHGRVPLEVSAGVADNWLDAH